MSRQIGSPDGSHVLPARLLSEFGTPFEAAHEPEDRRRWKVWAYSTDGAPKYRSVSTCFENGFYSFIDREGNWNHDQESRMAAEVEGPFNEILPLFKSDLYVACSSHSRIIARYFANIFNRSHQRRRASFFLQENSFEILKRMVSDKRLFRQLVAAYSFVLQRPVSLPSIQETMMNVYNDRSTARNQTQFLENLARYESDLTEILRGKPYGLLKAPIGSEFVLADTGVVTRQVLPNGLAIPGVGFDKSNVHALLPISPELCIQIGLGNLERYELRHDEVDDINRDSIKLMHRFAYGRSMKERTRELVKSIGGSLRYAERAFVTQEMTPEDLLDFFVFELLGGTDSVSFFRSRMSGRRESVALLSA